MKAKPKPAKILICEDDPGDLELIRRALANGKVINSVHAARDGEEALDFLLHRGAYADPKSSPRPDLIFLDLNMPKYDGIHVLKAIKEHGDLRRIPVVVLTTSKSDEDVFKTYDLGVNSYVQKPVSLEELSQVMQSLEQYWFEIVVLPDS